MWPIFVFWEMGLPGIVLHVVIGLLGMELLFRFWRKRVTYLKVHDFLTSHTWCHIASFDHATHCNICEMLLLADGMMCDSCGICVNNECSRKANRKLKCKPVSSDSVSMRHHWIKGNLAPNSLCHVCEVECGVGQSLSDYRCSWCQWTVHTKCLPNLSELCTLGTFRNFIIPPNCITLKRSRRVRLHPQCVVSSIQTPQWGPQWKPLIVIGNSKSGSNEACHVLSAARTVLNAVQSIDLCTQKPEVALQLCSLLQGTTCRLLIAGGDGTIAWVLNAVQDLKLEHMPESAILPLGTGNDLSRVLGWGSHFEGQLDFHSILRKIGTSSTHLLDRWLVEVRPTRHLGIRFPAKTVRFNNYFSVGVDARVALNFHLTRQSPFYLLSHRLFNRLIYFTFGTKDVVEQSCEGLDLCIQLFIDDQPIGLPPLQAVVFLNIDSWGAGVNAWTMGPGGAAAPKSDFGDGIIEVIGVSSSFHIAQMQFALSEPLRLGKGRNIKLVLSSILPVQADGEPWEQGPCEILIDNCGKVPMLMSNDE